MFKGRKLALTLAFTVLVALAFGVSCRGFFVKPTLTSIAINPTAPQVDVGSTETLTVYGTYDDGSRSVVTSGVAWSSDTTSVATIGTSTGVLTGVSPGSTGITASAQALSASATASVILAGVSSITVSPTSYSIHEGGSEPFLFTATAGSTTIDITTNNGGTLTITPTTSDITCSVSGSYEECSADSASTAPGTYSITMTYPGSSASATATLTVTP
ncbi:MAG: Ig-like domain-containing protein [Terriglobales bacterium]